MSGVEAIFVLGLLANIAGVADVSLKALKRIREVSEGARGMPRAFQDIEHMLPILTNALDKTRSYIDKGNLGDDFCRSLGPALSDGESKINELNLIFAKYLPGDNAPWLTRGWKTISSLRQDSKVEEICKHLWRLIGLLDLHYAVFPPANVHDVMSAQVGALSMDAQLNITRHVILPDQRTDDFIGRREQLKKLTSTLCQAKTHSRAAIVGLGGIGKSRLALQCVEVYRASDISIFWIYAGTADRMREGSRDIAKQIGLLGWDDPSRDPLQLLQEWLQSKESGRWLLIYDNVDDIDLMYPEGKGGLATHFPEAPHGSILITTRNRQVGIKFVGAKNAKNAHRLSALSDSDSIALLAVALGESDSDSETASRKKLAQTLEGIPLALVQASSFIQENETTTVDRYLLIYEASDADKVRLLSRDFEDNTRDSDLKNPIATTWIVTFEYLKKKRPLAAQTLCMMSVFDTRAIPETFVSEVAQGDPPQVHNIEEALSALMAYSLISSSNTSATCYRSGTLVFDLHRLVRLSTRNWLTTSSSYEYWAAAAVNMLSTKYDEIKEANYDTKWKVKSSYLPHALTLLESPQLRLINGDHDVPNVFEHQTIHGGHADEGHICPSCTANILTEMLSRNKSWLQKLRMTRKAVAIASHALGPSHLLTLRHRFNEAKASWRLEENERPDLAFRSVLADYTRLLGPNHIDTLRTERFLAETLNDQGKLDEAEDILVRSIATCSQEYDRHRQIIEAMQSLSTNLGLQGRYKEATAMNEKILDSSDNLNTKYKMSKNYVALKEYTKAKELCLQMLSDENALVADEYVSIDKVWQTLGQIYRKQKAYDKAVQILLQALSYRRSVYGENSRLTLYTKLYLADAYYHLGRYPEAESIQLSAIEPLTTHLGALNSEVLDVRWDLAWTWLKQNKTDESRKLALEVVGLVEKSKGEGHQQYIGMVRDLQRGWGVVPDGSTIHNECGEERGMEKENWRALHRTRDRSAQGFRHDLRTL